MGCIHVTPPPLPLQPLLIGVCSAYIAATKAGHGYAELLDVNKPAGKDNQVDKSESFWSGKEVWLLEALGTVADGLVC